MRLREATERDLDAILAIYNHSIRGSTALWSDEEVPRSDRAEWFARQRAGGCPVLVAEVGGVLAGYASYAPWRERSGYRFSVEDSVYIADAYQGRGCGRALLAELIARAGAAGHHRMVADIEAGNLASIRLHESLGFVHSGLVPEVGYKFGRWLDLAILTLAL
ncbi:MAG: GNAT family N-acetyltransferase [Microbacteriaceae bacterium]